MATTSFLKRLMNPGGRVAAEAGPVRLALAAFGKHPGWNDHIPGIGVETEALAHFKQAMYVTGIGGRIDAGAWKALEAEKRIEGFDQTFLCLRGGHVITGSMFSSEDGLRRKEYPMVLCVDTEGVSAGFILPQALAELDRLRKACRATASADQVATECRLAQDRLRGILAHPAPPGTGVTLPAEARRRFLDHHDLGPDRIGLLRALHELGAVGDTVRQGASGTGADGRSRHLRLPLATDSRNDSLLLWAEFFRCAVSPSSPLLLIARDGVDWMDAIVGEPTSDDFCCLQASLKALPLVSHIPYDLTPELEPRLRQLEAKFLGVEVATPVRAPVVAPVSVVPPPGAGRVAPETKTPRKGFNWLILLVGIIIVVAAVAGIWLAGGNRGSPPKSDALPRPSSEAAGVPQSDAQTKRAGSLVAAAPVKAPPEEKVETGLEAKRLADEKRIAEEQQAQETTRVKAQLVETAKTASEAKPKVGETRFENSAAQAKVRAEDAGLAQIAFAQGNYSRAFEISRKWAEIDPFKDILVQITAESNQLSQLTQYLQSGNYPPILNPNSPLPEKVSFAEIRTMAAAEKKILDQASAEFAGGDYAFVQRSEIQALQAKPPFQKLLQDGGAEAALLLKAKQLQAANQPQAAKDLIAQGKFQKPPFVSIQKWATDELERIAREQGENQTAKSLFEQADYTPALALCQKYSGLAAFDMLARSINEEEKVLGEAGKQFAAGDYSFLKELAGRAYKTKPPFAELLRKAAAEQKTLGELEQLKQAGDGPALQGKLGELPPAVSAKRPFEDLHKWAQARAEEQAEVRKKDPVWLDAKLDVLLVRFGILKPTDPRIKTPAARQEQALDGALTLAGSDYYLKEVNALENEYKQGGWLDQGDRKKLLKDLREKIKYGN